jgi:hypothetical protein
MYYKKSLHGGEFFTEAFTVWKNGMISDDSIKWLIVFYDNLSL